MGWDSAAINDEYEQVIAEYGGPQLNNCASN
jgi:hypothetical protein